MFSISLLSLPLPLFPPPPPSSPDDCLGLTANDNGDLAVSALGACVWCLKRCCIDRELLTMRDFEVCRSTAARSTSGVFPHPSFSLSLHTVLRAGGCFESSCSGRCHGRCCLQSVCQTEDGMCEGCVHVTRVADHVYRTRIHALSCTCVDLGMSLGLSVDWGEN